MRQSITNLKTGALFVLAAAMVFGCGERATAPAAPSLVLNLKFEPQDDPRVFSVGTLLVRAFDGDRNPLINTETIAVEESRATGRFDISFDVPAGEGIQILVEGRGSGLNPDGSKTESGVALQGLSKSVNILAAGVTVVDSTLLTLRPFIPDSLAFEFGNDGDFLVWKKMDDAETHTIRYQEFPPGDVPPVVRTIASGPTARVALTELRTVADSFLDAFQVASVNEFSESAFSDTLFRDFIGSGNP
ncbi:MAG: hypothetical protein HKN20_02060 [Gemmatimonadetes bacterium]|nr:hypothetical protein [Gemmatimonadota bacterium]